MRPISGGDRIPKLKPHRPLRQLLNAQYPDRGGPRPRSSVFPPRGAFLPPTPTPFPCPNTGRTGEGCFCRLGEGPGGGDARTCGAGFGW